MRCHFRVLAEKAGEVRGIGEGKIFGNLMDRVRAEYELPLGFREHTLADEMSCADAGRALDVVVELIAARREFFSIEAQRALRTKMLVHQRSQITVASPRDKVTAPVRARLAASRTTLTPMSASRPHIASPLPSRMKLCSSKRSANSAARRARSVLSQTGMI